MTTSETIILENAIDDLLQAVKNLTKAIEQLSQLTGTVSTYNETE